MDNNVFVIDGNNKLVRLSRSPYDSEALLQALLADHPAVLAGAAGEGGRLLLVRREAPVPESLGAAGRWSLDHLFLDAEGVPVLVEVKRATDTRLRREVVAQMLDYAANGVAYWPIEQLSAEFMSPEDSTEQLDALRAFLGSEDTEGFWRRVESNLKAGRIRMVFVADEIPRELRRIVEFLNEQMRPAEILAIEVEQFTGTDGLRLLTPRVIGATERAAATKAVETVGTKLPVRDDVRAFLLGVRDRVGAMFPGITATANPRKSLNYFETVEGGTKVDFRVHFGGWTKDVWTPIFVGVVLVTPDATGRDAWMKRFKAAEERLPPGTATKPSGDRTLDVSSSIEWWSPSDLSDELLNEVVERLGTVVTVTRDLLAEIKTATS